MKMMYVRSHLQPRRVLYWGTLRVLLLSSGPCQPNQVQEIVMLKRLWKEQCWGLGVVREQGSFYWVGAATTKHLVAGRRTIQVIRLWGLGEAAKGRRIDTENQKLTRGTDVKYTGFWNWRCSSTIRCFTHKEVICRSVREQVVMKNSYRQTFKRLSCLRHSRLPISDAVHLNCCPFPARSWACTFRRH